MVTVGDLKEKLGAKELTDTNGNDRPILAGYVCDLLSWVMAKGSEGMAWITVQTHLNMIAVACLHEFACVIIPEGIAVPEETIAKAEEEGIPVLSSDKTAYEICMGMVELGIGAGE